VYPHIGDLTKLAGYPLLKPNIIFCDYLLDHNISLRMDHQFKEDCRTVSRLKVSRRKNNSGTDLISITSLPKDKQTSKHGEAGRYNAILEFKGEQIKNFDEKGSLKCIRNFKVLRLKDPYSFSNHVQSYNEDLLCASGSLFAICTCPPFSSVCIFLFPSLI
jgi:hypothetical protein